jgi:hypothetical protein
MNPIQDSPWKGENLEKIVAEAHMRVGKLKAEEADGRLRGLLNPRVS